MRNINSEYLTDAQSPPEELGTMYFHHGTRADLTVSFTPNPDRKSITVNIFQYQSKGLSVKLEAREILHLSNWLERYKKLHGIVEPGS